MTKSVEKSDSANADKGLLPEPAVLTPEELDGVVGGAIAQNTSLGSLGSLVKGTATTGILPTRPGQLPGSSNVKI